MTSGEPALLAHLRELIKAEGPIPFARFMAAALYHPAHGYYSSGRAVIGRDGDYFTNVSVGPLFGRLLAAQFAEMWERLDRPNEFTLVEQGAQGGEFLRDVFAAVEQEHAEFFRVLRGVIVEPLPVLQERQAHGLDAFAGKVTWRESVEALAPFRGVHFSNELLDALPVHLVRWTGSEWLERTVALDGDGFIFRDAPVTSVALAQHLVRIPQPLPAGYETEINLAAPDWLRALAPKLEQGFVLAADYGFARDEFYAPHRIRGTLQCRARHRLLPSPFQEIGAADITAHVEWTSVIETAQEVGLQFVGFTDQHHFLTGLLAGSAGRTFESGADPKTTRALQTLLQPSLLGMKFQFLCLAKNVDAPAALSGFRFARPV